MLRWTESIVGVVNLIEADVDVVAVGDLVSNDTYSKRY